VAGGGDVDGDGAPDLLVGAPWGSGGTTAAGVTYLALGPISGDLDLSDADATLGGEGTNDLAGWSLALPGDVDDDGWDDLLIGAPDADALATNAGSAYLVLGGGL
jgi:hypothetical protein